MPPAGPAGRRRRLLILVICSLSLFIVSIDSTILNVALPRIEHQFHDSLSALQWVADAYLLVLASLLILAGSVADRIGRRRVFETGLLLFGLGSLLSSAAPSNGALVAFRMLQAVGGCMLTPVSLSIIRQVYTDPPERARAIGIWSAIYGIGVAAGPIVGGVLVTDVGWRSVFWVNVPVVLGAWALSRRFVPESRASVPRGVDPAGQILAIVALGTATFAIIEGPIDGWQSGTIVGMFAVATLAAAAFVVVERRVGQPLLEMHFFRSPPFAAANVVATVSYLVVAGFLFVNTLYLQDVRGDTALVAGLSLLPATAVIAVTSAFAGRLVARLGPRLPLVAAGFLLAASTTVLLGLTPTTPFGVLAVAYVLLGLGVGMVNPPITNTAVSGMPPDQAGVASAIASCSRQIGNVLGVAIMGSMVSSTAFGSGHLAPPAAVRFTGDSHVAWVLATAGGLVCALVALACTGRWGTSTAARIYGDETAAVAAVPTAP